MKHDEANAVLTVLTDAEELLTNQVNNPTPNVLAIRDARNRVRDARSIIRLVNQPPVQKFVRVETKPYGPAVRVVDIYPADENGQAKSTFSMCNVVHIEGRATIVGAGESIDDVERRALAMLEAVAVAREMEANAKAKV